MQFKGIEMCVCPLRRVCLFHQAPPSSPSPALPCEEGVSVSPSPALITKPRLPLQVSIKHVAQVDLEYLELVLKGQQMGMPYDAIQALDVVMRHLPSMRWVCLPVCLSVCLAIYTFAACVILEHYYFTLAYYSFTLVLHPCILRTSPLHTTCFTLAYYVLHPCILHASPLYTTCFTLQCTHSYPCMVFG